MIIFVIGIAIGFSIGIFAGKLIEMNEDARMDAGEENEDE